MATSSSSAHRLPPELVRAEREPDQLLPAPAQAQHEEDGRPTCQYFGDDAPTLRLVLPTAPAPVSPTDAIPTTPLAMARLRLRRVAKRPDSDRDDD